MNIFADLYQQILSYRSNSAPYQCLAPSWFVHQPNQVYFPRYRCHIEPLVCGEEVFGRISQDLETAKQSVDIITWGFDPGMVLVRGSTAEDGVRYGDLLKKIAMRKENPVRVRILVWHDDVVSQMFMKNNPGYYGRRLPSIGCFLNDYYSGPHQAFNAEWYSQVVAGDIPNVHLHVRNVPIETLHQSLSGEAPPISTNAKH